MVKTIPISMVVLTEASIVLGYSGVL